MSNYVTAIGLDVHARSIKACALNPMTGEVERASFGYDPASVAEWALGFESPKAVYESGVTGFHLCRALRALGLDCAVGAVSKMQRPAADRGRKTDRRDAEFLARLLATRNVVEVWVPDERTEAARDLSRALADARGDLQRAKQRMSKFLLRHGHVFDEPTPTGGRTGGEPTRSSSSSPTTPPPTSTTATACGAARRRATRWRGGSPSPPGGRSGSRPWTRSGA